MIMLFISLVQWWYGDGWRQRARLISNRLDGTIDYFSIELLLKTLFSPFRQISAGSVDGSLEAKFRAWADRMVSRAIGAVVRLILLVVGLLAIATQAVFGVVILIGWALVPLFPVIGIVLMIVGRTL